MTENLFDETPIDQIEIDPDKDYLADLVGDGKKFKTPEDLAKGKAYSDRHIELLEKRFDEMRNDYSEVRDAYASRASLEELIDQLKQQQLASSAEPLNANEDDNKPKYDPKEVESLVSSKIQEHEASKRQRENFDLVRNRLRERYGNNYKQILDEHAETLGLNESFVNNLAREHPAVFFKTFGLDEEVKREDFQTPIQSRQRSASFAPNTQKRTWAWYQDLKRSDPKSYYDPKTTTQMEKDYLELGSVFEDGNFKAVH